MLPAGEIQNAIPTQFRRNPGREVRCLGLCFQRIAGIGSSIPTQFDQDGSNPVTEFVATYFVTGDHPLYMAVYFAMIVFFTYFYVSITFNPTEVADNMKKYGGFIPGIRAGKPTEDYLSYVLSRITFPGALYLGLISLVPLIAFAMIQANQNFPFGGTSILIMVGVALDTVKQIESQLQQRNYEGFLK